jgi:hypothetical protein
MKTLYSRQQAIEAICDGIDDWDYENVLAFAKERLHKDLEELSLEELQSELNYTLGTYDTDNPDNELKVVDTKASKLLMDGAKNVRT